MDETDPTEPVWVEHVCSVPRDFVGDHTILALFQEAAPELSDRATFIDLVRRYLDQHQELLGTWQEYSYGKRVSEGPFLDRNEVGFFRRGRKNVQQLSARSTPVPSSSTGKQHGS